MNSAQDRFARLERAVAVASELPRHEREQWVAEFCAGDNDLRREIESFWAAEDAADNFLEKIAGRSFAVLAADGDGAQPRRFGNYTIIDEIGRGGMGAVFLAERADGEFTHRVAIKIVRQAIAEKELIERFRRERQILASLSHPNIASLLDGGVTDAGEPFLVMEYINGKPLIEHADVTGLGVDARLQLFLKCCRAVSFAHQNLIVHRDIKPSNILVDANGEPKLLDFGLAKVFDEALPEAERTETAFRALTPAYASPEQLRGLNVTTASDIYSLGVVLYELLTGQRPHDLSSNSFEEILRIVSAREPTKPSTAVGRKPDAGRDGDSSNERTVTNFHLKGDLDNIVLMALRKEPERRYKSVDQFAEDIERFLKNLPVIAREDTLGYRTSKFVQRNAVGVIAGTLVAAATLAGTVISRRQARRADIERERAQRRFNDLRQLSNSLMFEIHDSVQDLPGSTSTRQLIVGRALRYLDSLSKEAADDVSLQRELATAYKKVGDIQGNPYSANLGDIDGAMHTYASAREIYEALIKADPGKLDLRRDLAALYDRIGEIKLHASDTKGGFAAFESSLVARREMMAQISGDEVLQREIAVSLMKLGEATQKLGDLAGALKLEQEALCIFEELAENDPANLKMQRDVMLARTKIGYILFLSDKLSDALDNYRQAFATARRLASAQPENAPAQRDLSITYNNIGRVLLKQGNTAGAEDAFKRSLAVAEGLAMRDPKNELARSDVAYVLARLGTAQTRMGHCETALQNLKRALEINEALYRANPKHVFNLAEVGDCHHAIGECFEKMERHDDALASHELAIAARETICSADPSDAEYLRSLAESYEVVRRLTLGLPCLNSDRK